MVRFIGYQDADVDAAQTGQLEGRYHRLVGDEVGAGDPDPLLCGVDGVDEHEPGGLQHVGRARRDDQHINTVLVDVLWLPVESGTVSVAQCQSSKNDSCTAKAAGPSILRWVSRQ